MTLPNRSLAQRLAQQAAQNNQAAQMDVEVAPALVNEIEMKVANDVPNQANDDQAPAADVQADQQNNNPERRRP